MRLRLVYSGHFGKSEVTLFSEACAANPTIQLTADDVVLLVSKSGKQLRFVHRARDVVSESGSIRGGQVTVVSSRLYRIVGGGVWNPLLLSDYASEVGVELEGLRKFEEHYRQIKATR